MLDTIRRAGEREMRFGVIAVEKGFITPEQLFEALKAQVQEDLERENHRLLGDILLEQNVMTQKQKDEVLKTLKELKNVFGG